ncbi:MAG: hypothetical protein ACI835_004745 [Planctomycetota bacterium]|jgi:hypothetical protein
MTRRNSKSASDGETREPGEPGEPGDAHPKAIAASKPAISECNNDPSVLGAQRTRSADSDWRYWFAGNSPESILRLISQGDPLGLRALIAHRLADEAWILDPHLVHLRTLAHCAGAAARYQGRPALQVWLGECVAAAIAELVDEGRAEAEAPCDSAALADAQVGLVQAFAEPLGLDPRILRLCCARFNAAPCRERRTFFALSVKGQTLEHIARREGESLSQVAQRARRVLRILMDEGWLSTHAKESRSA